MNSQGQYSALVTQAWAGRAGKPQHEVISAVGSAVPLFQAFLALMAAVVPSRQARLVLTAVVLTKPLHLSGGISWSGDKPVTSQSCWRSSNSVFLGTPTTTPKGPTFPL